MRQFGVPVWEGSKTHSIRAAGGRNWRPGVTCNCFIDARQKTMARLGDWECVRVEPIEISVLVERAKGHPLVGCIRSMIVTLDGAVLTPDELIEFAWRDGFRPEVRGYSWMAMAKFWTAQHNAHMKPFHGQVIHWRWTKEGQAPRPVQLDVAA